MTKKDSNEQELLIRELGVFELRGLARDYGVPSPTTKKREELINLILEKLKDENGRKVIERKRRGRPYKKLSSIGEIVSQMTGEPGSEEKIKKSITFQQVLAFAQEPVIFEIKDDKKYIYEGIIRKNGEYYLFFVDNKWIYLVDNDYIEKLKTGDKILVEAKQMKNEDQYIVSKILKINDINASEYQIKDIEKGEEVLSNKTIPFGETFITEGRRNAFLSKEDLYENEDFKNLSKQCKMKEISLMALSLNTSYENQIYFKGCDFENFTSPYGSNNDINFNNVINAINYTQRQIDMGKKCILFIYDLQELLRALDRCFEKDLHHEHAEQTIIIIQKLMSLGKTYSSGESCTLLIGYNEKDTNDDFIANEILRICKKI